MFKMMMFSMAISHSIFASIVVVMTVLTTTMVTTMSLSSSSSSTAGIRIAAVFDSEQDEKYELAFRYAVKQINEDGSLLYGRKLVPEIIKVPSDNSFVAEMELCNVIQKGVAVIFGPHSTINADHIKSITDQLEIPFIDTRLNHGMLFDKFYKPSLRSTTFGSTSTSEYTINLQPDIDTLGQALTDLVIKYGWTSIVILYEDNLALRRIQRMMEQTSVVVYPNKFRFLLKQLKINNQYGYRKVLREVKLANAFHIVVDCKKENLHEILKQAQQIGIMTQEYNFLLANIDSSIVDIYDFWHGGTNFTTFRLIDTNNEDVKKIVESIVTAEFNKGRMLDVRDGNLDTSSALMYDAVCLFALALHHLSSIQDISVTPGLSCYGQSSWLHGSSLFNYMKLVKFVGVSGQIQYDASSRRSQFFLDVMELQEYGWEVVGTWNNIDSLNLTRVPDEIKPHSFMNVMANKTFVITLIQNPPYTMLKEETKKLEGNDRFEGFAIDLITEIATILHFNVSLKLVDDGNYGGQDSNGNWNGMMKEVMIGVEEGGADFAVADLSITSSRASAVEFSMPWMNLGISIIYIKPRQAPPSMLSFMSPFSLDVWINMALGYVIVSLVMFVIARLSPYEWGNPYPCIEEPEELENQFSVANSFWFTIGSLMQQGSDVAPTALSTRLLAGMWFFFALIMISSYTANLAAFLTVETLERPIESAEDLSKQNKIKYGVVAGGSTMNFFKTSNLETYQRMWNFMSENRDEVMQGSNSDGIEKVLKDDGNYAFMMESSSIEYITERKCTLVQVGGNLDNKGYGIAMRKGTPYKALIDSAILKLQEGGVLFKMKNKWWKQKRGGGACQGGRKSGGVSDLGLANVAGVFIVTLIGCIIATFLAICEFIYGTKKQAEDLGTSWVTEMKEEMTFALLCHGNTKTVRKREGGALIEDIPSESLCSESNLIHRQPPAKEEDFDEGVVAFDTESEKSDKNTFSTC